MVIPEYESQALMEGTGLSQGFVLLLVCFLFVVGLFWVLFFFCWL